MISGNLIQIDGESVPSCKSYEIHYEKVWGESKRNMAGDHRATLLGIDVIISAEFGGELLQADMTSLLPKLKQDYFGVTFYDPELDATRTAQYYVDSYDISLLSKLKGRFEPISVTFKPVSRSS